MMRHVQKFYKLYDKSLMRDLKNKIKLCYKHQKQLHQLNNIKFYKCVSSSLPPFGLRFLYSSDDFGGGGGI